MNQVAKRQEQAVAEHGGDGFAQMIERLATTPGVQVDVVERLLAVQERVMDRNAKAAYTASMVKMKPLLPVIDRKGRIEIRAKDAQGGRSGAIQQSTAFARWEDIDEAITPILRDHGFALTFRSGVAADGKITVTGVLSHEAGHSEETTISLPHDSSGSKNPVQAVGSSTSYGKRYTATLLLNIRTKGEDDDGKAGGAAATITPEQAQKIQSLIVETKSDVNQFLDLIVADSISDIPAVKFDTALNFLNAKKRAKAS